MQDFTTSGSEVNSSDHLSYFLRFLDIVFKSAAKQLKMIKRHYSVLLCTIFIKKQHLTILVCVWYKQVLQIKLERSTFLEVCWADEKQCKMIVPMNVNIVYT